MCDKGILCYLLSTCIPVSTDYIDDFDQSSDLDKCEDDEDDDDEFHCQKRIPQQIRLRPSKQLCEILILFLYYIVLKTRSSMLF